MRRDNFFVKIRLRITAMVNPTKIQMMLKPAMASGMMANRMEKAIHLKVRLFPRRFIMNLSPSLRSDLIQTEESAIPFLP